MPRNYVPVGPYEHRCPHCCEAFETKRKNKIYCTTRCRTAATRLRQELISEREVCRVIPSKPSASP